MSNTNLNSGPQCLPPFHNNQTTQDAVRQINIARNFRAPEAAYWLCKMPGGGGGPARQAGRLRYQEVDGRERGRFFGDLRAARHFRRKSLKTRVLERAARLKLPKR
jgi:hypothetical protein